MTVLSDLWHCPDKSCGAVRWTRVDKDKPAPQCPKCGKEMVRG